MITQTIHIFSSLDLGATISRLAKAILVCQPLNIMICLLKLSVLKIAQQLLEINLNASLPARTQFAKLQIILSFRIHHSG